MHETGAVETYASLEEVWREWAFLEGNSCISGYQTRSWTVPWLRTTGAALGLDPLFLLARDEFGAPAVLFALTLSRKAPVAVASYAGGGDSNVNMPLVRNDIALRAPDLHQILLAGARAAGVDAYALYNQPQDWGGRAHPLSQLAGWPSPSFLHSARLPSSSEQFMARLSGDARKRMRWRMRKLEQCGRVSFLHASKPEEIHSIITAFREQKKLRLRELGAAADLDVDLMAAFIADAALAGEPGVELHALLAGNRVAAMYCGLVHDGRYHAMANCYDATPDVSRTSPGELIMIFLLESLCKRGVREFDLGVGEAAYKDKWCERREPLFDTFHGVTPKGKVYALALGMKQRTKRRIKQSETLWPLAKKLRAAIRWRA